MNWEKLLSNQRIKKSETTDIRNEFESDFGRIIYSPALRRMHDKTQVFPLTTDDNIHSRLTHSNEVMSLGYTFGIRLSKSKTIQEKTKKGELDLIRILPILLQNVCLIHDIGNAPFGHFGETIVSDYFKGLNKNNSFFQDLDDWQKRDFINYDGNAQGLRVLTKLQYLDNPFGLNLTFATLASYLKYPNYEEINSTKEATLRIEGETLPNPRIEQSKHGVFYSEKEYFLKIIEECELQIGGIILRHPLCYLMEAADSIAYLCMDMEDGFNKGLFDIPYIKGVFIKNNASVATDIVKICDDKYSNTNTQIVNIRIKLIQYFVNLAFSNFEKNLPEIEVGKYNTELIRQDEHKVYKILSKICNKKIFTSREINYLESTGHSVFTGLLDFYISFIFNENTKYVKRAKSLISTSIINVAIEENLLPLSEKKLKLKIETINAEIGRFKENMTEIEELNKELGNLKDEEAQFEKLKLSYQILFNKQLTGLLTTLEKDEFKQCRSAIYKIIEPDFEDLDNYFKFRVIIDFISGMTDQYALNHYQKISGQKIN
jgi:dGTPase